MNPPKICILVIQGKIAKYDPWLDFKHKCISQLESNAKLIEKASEITSSLLWPNKKKTKCTFMNITPGSLLEAL